MDERIQNLIDGPKPQSKLLLSDGRGKSRRKTDRDPGYVHNDSEKISQEIGSMLPNAIPAHGRNGEWRLKYK